MNARARSAVAASLVLVLAGCGTAPVVTWTAPDSATAGATMPGAIGYLESARNQYRTAVARQLSDERSLGNTLIGAGALVAALAVGNAHRDAITGTALLAGTAYTIGNSNLQRQRVLIYQAGVDALNCAERATLPFAIGADEQGRLTEALDRLEASRVRLAAALADGRARRAKAANDSPDTAPLDRAIGTAEQVLTLSEGTLKAGRQFAAAASRGARELVSAVNGIDAAVVRSLITATPDLSSVPKLVSGLAGMIGSFAPGSGLEALVAGRIGAVGQEAGAKTEAAVLSEQQKATADIEAAVRDTVAMHANASARLAGRSATWPEEAFKDCGVAQVVAPLVVSASSLQFTTGVDARRLLDIDGGVKPYFVEIDGPAVDGLSVKSPVRFDRRAEVAVVGAKLAQPFETRLRVSDSSPTARTLDVAVAVVAAPAGGTEPKAAAALPAKPASAAAAAPAATVDADIAKLKQKARFNLDGTRFEVKAIPRRQGDTIVVAVDCPEGNTRVFKRADLVRAYLGNAGIVEPPRRNVLLTTQPAGCAAD